MNYFQWGMQPNTSYCTAAKFWLPLSAVHTLPVLLVVLTKPQSPQVLSGGVQQAIVPLAVLQSLQGKSFV